MKTKALPVGYPRVYSGNDVPPIQQVNGLVSCSILPPRKLYLPVLPYSARGKLVFGLCRTCMESGDSESCSHDDSQRVLHGCWVSDELKLALNKGYRIQKVFQIWDFDMLESDKTGSGGIFDSYVNPFLKIKQEASGYPSDCVTEEQTMAYIDDYERHEHIRLDPNKIKYNPGLRWVSKILLNSLYGKFAQRCDLLQTVFVRTREEFDQLCLGLSMSSITYYISATTGSVLERRNDTWRWWDFFWMLHIMDYDERENVNVHVFSQWSNLALDSAF